MGQRKNFNPYRQNINKASNRKVVLYEKHQKQCKKYNKKTENLDNYISEQKEKIRPYMVRKYKDVELRVNIVNEAIENNYPKENLEDLAIYLSKDSEWNLNVSDEILEKFENLQIYNGDAKREKGVLRRLIEKINNIFCEGGNE